MSSFLPFTMFGITRPGVLDLRTLPAGSAVYFDDAGPTHVVLEPPVFVRGEAVISPGYDFLFLAPSVFRPPLVQEIQEMTAGDLPRGKTSSEKRSLAGAERAGGSSIPPARGGRLSFADAAKEGRSRIEAVKAGAEPEGFYDRVLLARAYRHFGLLDEATELLGRMIFEGPWEAKKKARAHAEFAIALREQGRFDEALQQIDRALRIKETNPAYHCERGMILRASGRFEEAFRELDRARALDPTQARFYAELGALLGDMAKNQIETGRAREARRTMENALRHAGRAVQLAPDHPRHYCERAILLCAAKAYRAALTDHQKSVQLDDSHPRHFSEMTITLKEMDESKEAQKASRRARDLENRWQRLTGKGKK